QAFSLRTGFSFRNPRAVPGAAMGEAVGLGDRPVRSPRQRRNPTVARGAAPGPPAPATAG
ncbi:MAG: hypothetical protein ACLFSZ_09500, partial [Puniceicoccaceae bacterium]